MKSPLAVYVVYHTEFGKAHEIFSNIYKWLCRDIRSSLSDGLDIPVYFSTEANGFDVNFGRADKTCIVVLSDEHLVRAKDIILPQIREWYNRADFKDHVMICPVKLCEYAFDVYPKEMPVQNILLAHNNIMEDWDEFQTRLYDCLIRFIKGKPSKLQIFVSHSKKDEGKLGEVRAKELVQYLNTETKLNSFFDVKDILDGDRFDKQIEKGVENSLLIVLYTNTYSDREWCRRELIAAKDHHVPTIVIMMMDGETRRMFPYIGNAPYIVFDGEWRQPINLLLRTALDEFHEQELLSSLQNGRTDVLALPFPPELYSIRAIPEEKSCVLYPEPPLGQEELTILEQAHDGINFVTPMEFNSIGINLAGKYIAISISNSEDSSALGIGKEMLDDISIEISKHILKAGGKMIYGGDLRKSGYTDLFANLSYQYGIYEKTDSTIRYFKDYLAWPYYKDMSEDMYLHYDHNRVELICVAPGNDAADSQTKMRIEMEKEANARIIIGGKMNDYAGRMPGIIEEFKIALEMRHPIYIVGGFGGAARYIANVIVKKCEVEETYEWIKECKYDTLNNGLSEEDNNQLFFSTNVVEIISLVLKGLKFKLG